MPRIKKPKPQLQIKERQPLESEDLREYVIEANQVKSLEEHTGWQILQRDLIEYRNGIGVKLAYIDPKRPEFNEARILYCATDKILALVSDYKENRERSVELLNKLENPDLATVMDIDNEI